MSEGFRNLKRAVRGLASAKHSLLVTSLATRIHIPILFFMKLYGHLTKGLRVYSKVAMSQAWWHRPAIPTS